MNELLRIAVDAGLFFIACTVIFLVGFVLDARAQARRADGSPTGPGRANVRASRTSDRESEALEPRPVATA